jgi:hypothetical protein
MGATIVDAGLQAGLNYRTVVEPRVRRLMHEHPEAATTTGFRELVAFHGLRDLIGWSHPEKPRRIAEITWVFANDGVETEDMLRVWLGKPGNASVLLQLRGVGPKTVDYLRILVGMPALAVDRHVRSLVGAAGLTYSHYDEIRHVAEMAADHLGVSRDGFDRAIWFYLSQGNGQGVQVLAGG